MRLDARSSQLVEPAALLLTFEHEFDAPGAPASFATGWDGCLAELVEALAGTASTPEDASQRTALRRAYAEVFGEVPSKPGSATPENYRGCPAGQA